MTENPASFHRHTAVRPIAHGSALVIVARNYVSSLFELCAKEIKRQGLYGYLQIWFQWKVFTIAFVRIEWLFYPIFYEFKALDRHSDVM